MTYYGNGKSDWPLEMVNHLKSCHAKGMTDYELTCEPKFRGLSRNAIIGRRNRLGLKANKPTTPSEIRRRKLNPHQRRDKQPPVKVQLYGGWRPSRGLGQPVRDNAVHLPPGMVDLPADVPGRADGGLGIFDLQPDSCRYPCTGSGMDILYCGAASVEGCSWCERHLRVVYRPRAA